LERGDIDDAIHSAEGYGGLGAVASKRIEALPGAASKKDSECVFHRHAADILKAVRRFSFQLKTVDGSTGRNIVVSAGGRDRGSWVEAGRASPEPGTAEAAVAT